MHNYTNVFVPTLTAGVEVRMFRGFCGIYIGLQNTSTRVCRSVVLAPMTEERLAQIAGAHGWPLTIRCMRDNTVLTGDKMVGVGIWWLRIGSLYAELDAIQVMRVVETLCAMRREKLGATPTDSPYVPKAGDRVTVTGKSLLGYAANGRVGTVRRIASDETTPVVIDFDNYKGGAYRTEQVALAQETVPAAPSPSSAWEQAATALESAGLTGADPYVDIIQRTQPGGLTVRPSATEKGKVTLHLTGVRQDVGRRLTPAQARRLAFLLNREADAADAAERAA